MNDLVVPTFYETSKSPNNDEGLRGYGLQLIQMVL